MGGKKNKNILFLTLDFPPMQGGMARHCFDAASALRENGWDVTAIAPACPVEDAVEGNSDTIRLRLKPGRIFDNYAASVWKYAFAGFRHCLSRKPRLVCASTWTIAGVAAYLLRKLTGARYAVFCHGFDVLSSLRNARAARLMGKVLRAADTVIANSSYTAGLLKGIVAPSRLAVVNPCVDTLRFSPVPAAREELPGEPCILSVGRLVASKGHEFVIRAMRKVTEQFPGAVYCLAGEGPCEDSLRGLVKELKLERNVFFAGFVPEDRLPAYYASCDLFVLASCELPETGEVEGFGICLLEAAACGKPAVATLTGGIPDAVENGATGVLVGPRNPDALAEAMLSLLSDPASMAELGKNARKRVCAEFTRESFGRRLEGVLLWEARDA